MYDIIRELVRAGSAERENVIGKRLQKGNSSG